VLPLISKQWAHALRGPSHAWQVLAIDGGNNVDEEWEAEEHSDDALLDQELNKPVNAAALLDWFSTRSG